MSIFEKEKVKVEVEIERDRFKESLNSKAVRIVGKDLTGKEWNQAFLVMKAESQKLWVFGSDTNGHVFSIEDFTEGWLRAEVLDTTKKVEMVKETVPKSKGKNGKGIPRPNRNSVIRTNDQNLIRDILKEQKDRPVTTYEIRQEAIRRGRTWPVGSTTHYTKDAKKVYPQITHLGFATWQWKEE